MPLDVAVTLVPGGGLPGQAFKSATGEAGNGIFILLAVKESGNEAHPHTALTREVEFLTSGPKQKARCASSSHGLGATRRRLVDSLFGVPPFSFPGRRTTMTKRGKRKRRTSTTLHSKEPESGSDLWYGVLESRTKRDIKAGPESAVNDKEKHAAHAQSGATEHAEEGSRILHEAREYVERWNKCMRRIGEVTETKARDGNSDRWRPQPEVGVRSDDAADLNTHGAQAQCGRHQQRPAQRPSARRHKAFAMSTLRTRMRWSGVANPIGSSTRLYSDAEMKRWNELYDVEAGTRLASGSKTSSGCVLTHEAERQRGLATLTKSATRRKWTRDAGHAVFVGRSEAVHVKQ
ncbi:hypothetical protein B0H14DRAFT_2583087 [Mycena olivaceomarginata]|nr:hypothetical protein B0H14DRAFT_2583087 [Mycena olivaceomarginata]